MKGIYRLSAIVAGTALAVFAIVIAVRANPAPAIFITTVNATYPATGSLKGPTAVFMNPVWPQYLFIADTGHHQIDGFFNGALHVLAGSGSPGSADGPSLTATFNKPMGLGGQGYWQAAAGRGNQVQGFKIWIYDTGNNLIRYLNYTLTSLSGGTGTISTLAGSGQAGFANGSGTAVLLNAPGGQSPPGVTTSSYFADIGNNAIRVVTNSGEVSSASSSNSPGYANGPLATARFMGPTSVTTDTSNNSYVTDSGNFVIRKIDSSENVTTFAGNGIQGYKDGPASVAEFASPVSSIYNSADGYIYVADPLNNCIRRIDSSGNVSTYAGTNSPGLVNGSLSQSRFANPSGLTIGNGVMYVADASNNAIRAIDMTTGTVVTLIQ